MSAKYPADTLGEAVELAIQNSNQFHVIFNGAIDEEVNTYEGEGAIPTIAKAMFEAAAYKVPVAWQQSTTENDLLQPRIFEGFVYVPRKVPAPMLASPDDTNWRYHDNPDQELDKGTYLSAEALTVNTLGFLGSDAKVRAYDPDGARNLTDEVVLILNAATAADEDVSVLFFGTVTVNSISSGVQYATTGGAVTATPPSTGYELQVGRAIGPNEFYFKPVYPAFFLGA